MKAIYTVDILKSKLNIPSPKISWPWAKNNFQKVTLKSWGLFERCHNEIWQIKWNQQDKFQGKYGILTGSLATWSVRQLLVSTAHPSLSDDGWNQVLTPQGIPDKNKNLYKCINIKQICWEICLFTAIDHHNSAMLMMRRSQYRLYTTIENPCYVFITLSCTEAIQSFISRFNQYSLVDHFLGNIFSLAW